MPYPTHLAATLSGASVGQLSYWRSSGEQGPLFTPELPKAGGRVLYSFRDVVALRTFVYLRDAVSLQRIRKAVETLRELGNIAHLSNYRLEVVDGSIVLVEPDAPATVDLVERPGAQRFKAVLGDVFAPFTNQQGRQVVDLLHPRRHVLVDPDIRGGYPVVNGTRVEFDLVASLVRDGIDPAVVREFYPSVTAEGAVDALDFANEVDQYRHGGLGMA